MKYEENSVIYKWVADVDGDFTAPGPNPALICTFRGVFGEILDYGIQTEAAGGMKFVCWTIVDKRYVQSAGKNVVTRVAVPTGGGIPKDARYIKTLQLPNGLVYHIFAPFDLS